MNLYYVIAILVLLFAFWMVMLMDCVKRPEHKFHTEMQNPKRLWMLLIIVGIPWCAIVYFISVKLKD